MDTLFAPWRMEFIERGSQFKTCVLCEIPESNNSELDLIIYRGRLNYVVMNRYPYTHGHIMVVPYLHESDWTKLLSETLLEMSQLTQKAITVFRRELQCEAFNIGVNLGRVAGAGIDQHVHQHIVPRWTGDFNFMPLLAETKVISEHLIVTRDRLKGAWQ